MRISPVYTPQNIINNPPHITNHPMLEHTNIRTPEFKANEKELFHQVLKKEKRRDNIMTAIFIGMLGIAIFSVYKAYSKFKDAIARALK